MNGKIDSNKIKKEIGTLDSKIRGSKIKKEMEALDSRVDRESIKRRGVYLIIVLFLVMVFVVITGNPGEEVEHFDVGIRQHKDVFTPNKPLDVEIIVKDRETGEPVTGANVYASMKIYQGGAERYVELPAEDEGFYEVEQKIITKKILNISAHEIGNGIYVLEKNIGTEASFGGVTLKVTIHKDGHIERVEKVVTFMGFDPWLYAIGITFTSIILGLIIGFIFGGFHR